MNKFLYSLVSNNLDGIRLMSKIIALDIRNQMENFHVDHLSDAQMKVLNPLIRNAVFNSLVALSHYPHPPFNLRVDYNFASIPTYWEEPELTREYEVALEMLNELEIVFRSDFLNQEYELGNIYALENRRLIRLRGAFEFKGVDYKHKDKHRAKIVNHLHKDGYRYNALWGAYEKMKFFTQSSR